jgi:hypothetical protein
MLRCPHTVLGVPRSVVILGRAAAYLAVFVAVAALDTIVATTWVRPDVVAVVGTFLWCVPIVVLYIASPWSDVNARVIWLMAAWFVSVFLMGAMALGLWTFVLHQRGEQVVATVIEVHAGQKSGTTYTLAHDGAQIPGRLTTWPGDDAILIEDATGSLGERITVVIDPNGLVDPRLPDEFADAHEGFAALLATALAVMSGLCLGASWARNREEDSGRWQSRKARTARARTRKHLAARAAARKAAHNERHRQLLEGP